jgi:type VI secretion system protein ImpF
MPTSHADQPLVPSVLDRLLDDEPELSKETSKSRTQVLRELKQTVRRDLENLLNTRWRCVSWPPNLDELEVSLANYGIPDFVGMNMGIAEDREQFRRILEKVIRNYEPRFKKVDVRLVQSADQTDRTLRFRIDALLHAEPAPEPVVFDTALEPVTQSFEVKGSV